MKKQKSKQFIQLCKKYTVDSDIVPEILTYEQACKLTNRNPKLERDDMQKTMVVIDAFCKQSKWTANYKNKNQYKYLPVFEMKPTGLVFSNTLCGYWYSRSFAIIGAPFVLPTRDHARFVGSHFLPLYKKWMLNFKVK